MKPRNKDYDAIIDNANDALNIYEEQGVKDPVTWLTPWINQLMQVHAADPDYDYEHVMGALAVARWHRGLDFYGKKDLVSAQKDFEFVALLRPDDENVKKFLQLCQPKKPVYSVTQFTKKPSSDAIKPKPRKADSGELGVKEPQPAQKAYVKIGSSSSAFYRHEHKPSIPKNLGKSRGMPNLKIPGRGK